LTLQHDGENSVKATTKIAFLCGVEYDGLGKSKKTPRLQSKFISSFFWTEPTLSTTKCNEKEPKLVSMKNGRKLGNFCP